MAGGEQRERGHGIDARHIMQSLAEREPYAAAAVKAARSLDRGEVIPQHVPDEIDEVRIREGPVVIRDDPEMAAGVRAGEHDAILDGHRVLGEMRTVNAQPLRHDVPVKPRSRERFAGRAMLGQLPPEPVPRRSPSVGDPIGSRDSCRHGLVSCSMRRG